MSLQLYQVDFKSYLLDFKSLSSDSEEAESTSAGKLNNINPLIHIYKFVANKIFIM